MVNIGVELPKLSQK